MSDFTIVRASDLHPTPWRNGRGVTRDVVTHLGSDGALAWQISIADLTQDADFSHFPFCERAFTLVEGDPVELDFEGRASMRCAGLVPARFPGDWPTRCRLTGGPARAFNAISDRRLCGLDVTVRMLAEGHAPALLRPVSAVHCVSGKVALPDGATLGPGDTLLGEPIAAVRAEAASATIILVRITDTHVLA